MDDKLVVGLIVLVLIAVAFLAGCTQSEPSVTVPEQPVVPETPSEPSAPAQPPAQVPEQQPQAPDATNGTNGTDATPADTPPAEPEKPIRIGIDLPPEPTIEKVRFILTSLPANTPNESLIYIERYNVDADEWTMYNLSYNSLLGWTIELDASVVGKDDNAKYFYYRYSRDGAGYDTAERFVWDSPKAYRTRLLSEVAGEEVIDQVKEWRDLGPG